MSCLLFFYWKLNPTSYIYFFSSTRSRENPFRPGSDLEKEAEEFIKSAKITKGQFLISPSDHFKPTHFGTEQSAPNAISNSCNRSNHSPVNGNIQAHQTNENFAVVQVSTTEESQKAEIVRVDDSSQKKCCTIS